MSKHYEAPAEIRELEKYINDFSYKYGLERITVFQDLLRYIINGFSLPGTPPLTDWRYNPEQGKGFYEMYCIWIKIMNRQIAIHGWYDAFGNLFMSITSQKSQQYNGQFFTPEDLCELVTAIVRPQPFKGVYDPAGGSGRFILAARAVEPRIWGYSQDVDYLCSLMTVCNMLMNSCVGEVVCMNTITMQDFRGAWLINEFYFRTGMPSIRVMSQEEYIRFDRADMRTALLLDQKGHDDYVKFKKIWTIIKNMSYNGTEKSTDEGGGA